MVKDTGLTKEQLHEWAKTENELKLVCQPEEIAGTPTVTTDRLCPIVAQHACNDAESTNFLHEYGQAILSF